MGADKDSRRHTERHSFHAERHTGDVCVSFCLLVQTKIQGDTQKTCSFTQTMCLILSASRLPACSTPVDDSILFRSAHTRRHRRARSFSHSRKDTHDQIWYSLYSLLLKLVLVRVLACDKLQLAAKVCEIQASCHYTRHLVAILLLLNKIKKRMRLTCHFAIF